MRFKKLFGKTFVIGSVVVAVLTAGVLVGCTGNGESGGEHDSKPRRGERGLLRAGRRARPRR